MPDQDSSYHKIITTLKTHAEIRGQRFLTILLLTAGIGHFLTPKPFDRIVPRSIPGSARLWTYISGAIEIILGIGLIYPKTRKIIANLSAVFFLGVFPANIKMVVDWRKKALPLALISWLRLPLQYPLIKIALSVAQKTTNENNS